MIRIPTEDQLAERLTGLDRLSKAVRWERAAIVWAFTTDEDKGGGYRDHSDHPEKRVVVFPVSLAAFARLGYASLVREETVSRYRALWQEAIDNGLARPVAPGDEVELPEDDAWPTDSEQWRKRQVRDDDRRTELEQAAEAAGVSVSSVLRTAASPKAVDVYNSTLSPEKKAEQVREYLTDPKVAAEVADRETVEKVAKAYHDKQPTPRAQPRKSPLDYDEMVGKMVDLASAVIAAEREGSWKPSTKSEALLYFLSRALDDRNCPPGNWDALVNEVEAFANQGI